MNRAQSEAVSLSPQPRSHTRALEVEPEPSRARLCRLRRERAARGACDLCVSSPLSLYRGSHECFYLYHNARRELAHATICAALRLGHQPCVLSEDVGSVRVLGETLLLLALRIANRLVALLLHCGEPRLPQRTPRPESATNPNVFLTPNGRPNTTLTRHTFLVAACAVSTCSVSRACTSSVLSCTATFASTRARRSPSAILFATSFTISRSSSASRSRFFRSSFDFSLLSRSRIRCCARNPNFSPASRSSSLLTMRRARL